jgi:hypothetical protein
MMTEQSPMAHRDARNAFVGHAGIRLLFVGPIYDGEERELIAD